MMKLFGKPKNRWGGARIAGWLALSLVLLWTLLAAALRSLGAASWLAWSGYQSFSLLDGVELSVIPLLVIFLFGWLEDHDHRVATEQSHLEEKERAAAAHRSKVLQHVQEALLAEINNREHGTGVVPVGIQEELSAPSRQRIQGVIRAALPELDGPGKGDFLRFLFERGLLQGEKPAADLSSMDFAGAWLQNAQLNGIRLAGLDFRRARMDGAHLEKSALARVNLSKAFLRRADLREAQLDGCNLSGAHLEEANLESASLWETRLDGAYLIKANLLGCRLESPEALERAVLVETVLPDGRNVTNEKGKEYLRNKELAMLIDRL